MTAWRSIRQPRICLGQLKTGAATLAEMIVGVQIGRNIAQAAQADARAWRCRPLVRGRMTGHGKGKQQANQCSNARTGTTAQGDVRRTV